MDENDEDEYYDEEDDNGLGTGDGLNGAFPSVSTPRKDDGDGLPDIGKNRRRFNTVVKNKDGEGQGDGKRPDWNLRIDRP
jgi:hypothetical protein